MGGRAAGGRKAYYGMLDSSGSRLPSQVSSRYMESRRAIYTFGAFDGLNLGIGEDPDSCGLWSRLTPCEID